MKIQAKWICWDTYVLNITSFHTLDHVYSGTCGEVGTLISLFKVPLLPNTAYPEALGEVGTTIPQLFKVSFLSNTVDSEVRGESWATGGTVLLLLSNSDPGFAAQAKTLANWQAEKTIQYFVIRRFVSLTTQAADLMPVVKFKI